MAGLDIPIDEVVHFDAITSSPTTGAVTDADSTPTFAVYEESTDTDIGIGGNMTKRTALTGNYRGSFTASIANGFEAGKFYSVIASATVGAIAGKCVALSFRAIAVESTVGVSEANLATIIGTAPTEGGAGRLAGSFTKLYDVATPALVASDVMRGTNSAALAAKLLAYIQLITRGDEAIETDNATELAEINADGGSGAGDYKNDQESLEAILQRGNVAWLTGAGSGATESYTEDTNWTRTTGDNDGGSPSDTISVDGVSFVTGETGAGVYLQVDAVFTITSGETADVLDVWGMYSGGAGHSIQVLALDTVSGLYEPIGSMANESSITKHNFGFSPGHTNDTVVTVRFLHQGGTGVAAHAFHVDKAQVNTITPATPAPSAETIADAVWDEIATGHIDAGKAGAQLWTDIDAILVDTNSLNDTKILQTLNLTASGNIGIDWANVENPTTTVGLPNTTVALANVAMGGSSLVLTMGQLVINNASGIAVDIDGSDALGAVDIVNNSGFAGSAVRASGRNYGIHGIGTVGSGIYGLGATAGIEAAGFTNGDGLLAAKAGTGVDIRGDITGDITGTVAEVTLVNTLTTYTGNTLQTADVAGVPTIAEFEARTLLAAAYFDPTADAVATVTTLTNKTGFGLASNGLDSIVVETGLNARQALAINASASGGKLSGAATTTVTILGAGVATTRITSTVDADGNRTAVTLAPPA